MGRANCLSGGGAVVSRLRGNDVAAGGCDGFRAETSLLRGNARGFGQVGGVGGWFMAVRLWRCCQNCQIVTLVWFSVVARWSLVGRICKA